eukprot:2358462-Pyramimonas_sp.AAC.1
MAYASRFHTSHQPNLPFVDCIPAYPWKRLGAILGSVWRCVGSVWAVVLGSRRLFWASNGAFFGPPLLEFLRGSGASLRAILQAI